MQEIIEAYKMEDGTKHPKTAITVLCKACGHNIEQAEVDAGQCSDCGESLAVKQSVSIWATSVPAAGGKTLGS